jgi:hypothetical protein
VQGHGAFSTCYSFATGVSLRPIFAKKVKPEKSSWKKSNKKETSLFPLFDRRR